LLTEVKAREIRRAEIRRELLVLDQQESLASTDRGALEERVRSVLRDWRGLLGKHVAQARQIISKLLDGRLSVTPECKNRVRGFRLSGTGSFLKCLSELPQIPRRAVASPTGTSDHQILSRFSRGLTRL